MFFSVMGVRRVTEKNNIQGDCPKEVGLDSLEI